MKSSMVLIMNNDILYLSKYKIYGDAIKNFYVDETNLYEKQLEQITNRVLTGNIVVPRYYTADVTINDSIVKTFAGLNYINKGEFISGSFVMNIFNADILYNDVDIYFKNKEDAIEFLNANRGQVDYYHENPLDYKEVFHIMYENDICMCVNHFSFCQNYGSPSFETKIGKINLIYGFKYDSPVDIISQFDFRACANAIDPNDMKLYTIEGAIMDAYGKNIVIQTSSKNILLRRLINYISKNFRISPNQRLIFLEMLNIAHNTDLEICGNESY